MSDLDRIGQIELRLQKMTLVAGWPWIWFETHGSDKVTLRGNNGSTHLADRPLIGEFVKGKEKAADFACAAPEDINWLLSEVRRLLARKDHYKVELEIATKKNDSLRKKAQSDNTRNEDFIKALKKELERAKAQLKNAKKGKR